jgi:hypothetical protein
LAFHQDTDSKWFSGLLLRLPFSLTYFLPYFYCRKSNPFTTPTFEIFFAFGMSYLREKVQLRGIEHHFVDCAFRCNLLFGRVHFEIHKGWRSAPDSGMIVAWGTKTKAKKSTRSLPRKRRSLHPLVNARTSAKPLPGSPGELPRIKAKVASA